MAAPPRGSIYFFGGRSPLCRIAFDRLSTWWLQVDWRFYAILTEADRRAFRAERHSPSVVLSFLNPFILDASLLATAAAFNVHPAPPEYPGRDPWHFAHYDGYRRAGATLHRMTPRVDDGEIVDVLERDLDPDFSVAEYHEACKELAMKLLFRSVGAILDRRIAKRCQRSWRGSAKRSRKDFV